MPISSRTVVQSTFAFLIVGLLALLAIVATTIWLGERAQALFELAIEARDTRAAAVDLRNAVQTAESSQRGYLLTSNEIYLAPYPAAKASAQRQTETLRNLLEAYPESATPVQRLAAIVSEKLEEIDQTIALKRARHDEDADAIVRTNRGKTLMDEANIFFTGLIIQAEERLTAAVDEQRANAFWQRLVSAIGALVIIAVVGGATFVLWRYTRELRATRDELNSLNAALETRVGERTADLVQARDRAEVLLREVNHRVANSLALVSSLVSLQARSLQDPAARHALKETQDRIFAISLVHRRLYGNEDVRSVTLDEFLSSLLEHLKTSLRNEGQGASLTYDLEPVKLATDQTVSLGVVVTEWVTNAFKYAYPAGPGEIRVRLRQLPEDKAELVVEDDGVGHAEGAPAKGTGLGSRIVGSMAANLGAVTEYLQRAPGTAARLVFPTNLKQRVAAAE